MLGARVGAPVGVGGVVLLLQGLAQTSPPQLGTCGGAVVQVTFVPRLKGEPAGQCSHFTLLPETAQSGQTAKRDGAGIVA